MCDEAYAVVEEVCAAAGERWVRVAIDDDPALLAAYAELIPVVIVDGVAVAHWRVTAEQLEVLLRS